MSQLSLQVVSLFETNKEQRQNFAIQIAEALQEGKIDPLTVHLQVKCMEDVVKQITSNSIYKRAIVDRAEQQGQKSFEFHNAKFEIKETGVKYDFLQCNDPELTELQTSLSELEEKVKARQTFLKTVPEKGLDIITKEGEAVTVYPPSKSSTTNVAVTLK